MPNICVTPFCPHEKYHLFLCELDDTTFIVDAGWQIEPLDTPQPANDKAARTSQRLDPVSTLSTVNWALIDFILISNYEQMALLPYITEYTEFSGPVYATEPTKSYGRCVLEEQMQFAYSTSSSASQKHLYSQRDIIAAMEKITDVRHNEIVSPMPFVQAYTRSSGYCIGGGNWTVEYKGHRTAFVSTSALACLHPQEYDPSCIAEAQAIVYCDVSDPQMQGTMDSENIQVTQRLNQLCSTAIATLKQRGRVMLVGEPYGVTQDILQAVIENSISLNLPLPQVVVVSPVGERALQYGNIMGEWLCESKQALLYLPEYPFLDKELRQKGHLHFVESLGDLARRHIPQGTWFVIASPRDTRTIEHFIRQWRLDAQTCSSADMAASTGMARFSILMHDDDVVAAQALVDRLAATAEMTYCPVPRRFTAQTVEQTLRGAGRAQHVLVPSHVYARLSTSHWEFALCEFSHLNATLVSLDTDRHLPLNIQRELADSMRAQHRQHSLVTGVLALAAGNIRLECEQPVKPPKAEVVVDVAKWTPEALAEELIANGLDAAADHPNVRVAVPGGTAVIRMDGEQWQVDCTSASAQWVVFDSLKRVLES
ncbi:Integrator complex subunit 9 [Linderina pennispora]|nr:Integrator complex subunit 9 [Linderina pennispora]